MKKEIQGQFWRNESRDLTKKQNKIESYIALLSDARFQPNQ